MPLSTVCGRCAAWTVATCLRPDGAKGKEKSGHAAGRGIIDWKVDATKREE